MCLLKPGVYSEAMLSWNYDLKLKTTLCLLSAGIVDHIWFIYLLNLCFFGGQMSCVLRTTEVQQPLHSSLEAQLTLS